MSSKDPNSWECPQWHADCGNPAEELAMLRNFCNQLLADSPECRVELDCYEQGYMRVLIFSKELNIGELHVVNQGTQRRFGLFIFGKEAGEQEIYFDRIEEGLGYLAGKNAE